MQSVIDYVTSHLALLAGVVYVIVDEIFAFNSGLKSNSILNFIYNQAKALAGKS